MSARFSTVALAALAVVAPVAPATAAGASVKLELTLTVEVPTRKAGYMYFKDSPVAGEHHAFLRSLKRDLQARAQAGVAGRAELAQLAAAKMGGYPRSQALLGRPGKPTAAEVEVSLSIKIKVGTRKLDPQDARFVRQLEAELERALESGRIDPSDVEAQVQQRMAQYSAARGQGGAAGPGWGDKPGVSVMLSITIKF